MTDWDKVAEGMVETDWDRVAREGAPDPSEPVWESIKKEWEANDGFDFKEDIVEAIPKALKKQAATTFGSPGDDPEGWRARYFKEATGEDWMTERDIQRLPLHDQEKARRRQGNVGSDLWKDLGAIGKGIIASPILALEAGSEAYEKSGGYNEDFAKEIGSKSYGFGREIIRWTGKSGARFGSAPVTQLQEEPLEFISNLSIVGAPIARGAGMAGHIGKTGKLGGAWSAGQMAKLKYQNALRPTVMAKKAIGSVVDKGGPTAKTMAMRFVDPDMGLPENVSKPLLRYEHSTPGTVYGSKQLGKFFSDVRAEHGASGLKIVQQAIGEGDMIAPLKREAIRDYRVFERFMKSDMVDLPQDVKAKAIQQQAWNIANNPSGFDRVRREMYRVINAKKRTGEFSDLITQKEVKSGRVRFNENTMRDLHNFDRATAIRFKYDGESMSSGKFLLKSLKDEKLDPARVSIEISSPNPILHEYADEVLKARRFLLELDSVRPNIVTDVVDGKDVSMRNIDTMYSHAGGYFPDFYSDRKRIATGSIDTPSGRGNELGFATPAKHKSKTLAQKEEMAKAGGYELAGADEAWEIVVPKQVRANAYYTMLQEIRDGGGALSKEQFKQALANKTVKPSQWEKMPRVQLAPKISKWGAITDHYVPKEVAWRLRAGQRFSSQADNMVKRAVRGWKSMKIINNPSGHMHNMIGTITAQILDGDRSMGLSIVRGAKSILKQDEYYKAAMRSGALQESARQVGLLADAYGDIASSKSALGAVEKGLRIADNPAAFGDKAMRAWEWASIGNPVTKRLRAYATGVDNSGRVAVFRRFIDKNHKAYGSKKISDAWNNPKLLEDAAKHTNLIMLDYAKMPFMLKAIGQYGFSPYIAYAWKSTGMFNDINALSPFRAQAVKSVGQIQQDTMSDEERKRQALAPYWRPGHMTQQIDKTAALFDAGPTDINMRWMNPVPTPEDILGQQGIGGYGADLFREDRPMAEQAPGVWGTFARPLAGKSYTGKDIEVGSYDFWKEIAYGLTPGAVSHVNEKLIPAIKADETGGKAITPRGEEITPGKAMGHIVGIRLHEPSPESSVKQAKYGMLEKIKQIEATATAKMRVARAAGNTEEYLRIKKQMKRDIEATINRMVYLFGDKSVDPSYKE